MTSPSHARLSANVRARLISAARTTVNEPDTAITLSSPGVWGDTDPTPATLRSLGAGAVFVEYLIGFHGLHPDDAIFEAASLPPAERRARTNAAWHDMRTAVAHHPNPLPPCLSDAISPHL